MLLYLRLEIQWWNVNKQKANGSRSNGSLEVPELVFEPMFALVGDLGSAVKGS